MIFPDRAESVPGWEDPGSYWLYAPDRPPARVIRTGREREYKIIGQKPFPTSFLFSQGTVFESIGGGVILVKDFIEDPRVIRAILMHLALWDVPRAQPPPVVAGGLVDFEYVPCED